MQSVPWVVPPGGFDLAALKRDLAQL